MTQCTFRAVAMFMCVAILGIAGCGKTTTVTGKVTYRGRPVRYGSVTFLSSAKVARSSAIESDGSYTIYDVPPGNVKIAVTSRNPRKGRFTAQAQHAVQPAQPGRRTTLKPASTKPPKDWFALPAGFESPETSGLSCDVVGAHAEHDIELK